MLSDGNSMYLYSFFFLMTLILPSAYLEGAYLFFAPAGLQLLQTGGGRGLLLKRQTPAWATVGSVSSSDTGLSHL